MTRLACTLALLMVLLLAACQLPVTTPVPVPTPTLAPNEADVPFETIVQDQYGAQSGTDLAVGGRLMWLTEPQQLDTIREYVTPDALEKVQQVDFSRYDVVALFRGDRGSSDWQTMINRITRRDNHLIVHALLYEPNPHFGATQGYTSPYHIVKIVKPTPDTWVRELVLEPTFLTPEAPFPN